MSRFLQEHRQRQEAQRGFALPLALIAIALLSIITIAGYRAVSGAAVIVTSLQDNALDEQALFSAEAEATFTFLTGANAVGGILTGVKPGQGADPFGNAAATESLDANALWRANGESRLMQNEQRSVTVNYYDAAGFPPVFVLADNQIAALLLASGFKRDQAIEFAARIGDYQDGDDIRRFRGAERADYRLFGVSPPANSPLRTAGELASVLGFSDAAPFASWDFLTENARFGGVGTVYSPSFGPEKISGIFSDESISELGPGGANEYAVNVVQPSDTARFLLTNRSRAGLTRRRAVEIMRTAGAVDKPFRRVWIYDKVENDNGSATAADEQRNMAPVFQPAPPADPG